MHPESIQKLIKLFSKFPTVGPRTAARFVFYLTQISKKEIDELLEAINAVKNNINGCVWCYKSYEKRKGNESRLCPICANNTRDKTTICVVEKEIDLEAIEKTHQFKGLYFILGGRVEQRVNKLIERIKTQGVKEIIIALNPTTEGQNIALWLKRQLEPLKIKTTQLGRGLPMGGELEYADDETLESALKNRQ